MNRKQIIIAWVIIIIIILHLGIGLAHLRLLDDTGLLSNGERFTLKKYYAIEFYGFSCGIGGYDFGYDRNKLISTLIIIQENKYQLLIPILLIGGLLIYTLKDKKK